MQKKITIPTIPTIAPDSSKKFWSRLKYKTSRHRYSAFVLLAVIALVLPHIVNANEALNITLNITPNQAALNITVEEEIAPELDPEQNYCKDSAQNDKWGKALAEYPEDPIIIKLFALRAGLCVMVDAGAVSLTDAINYFEEEREKLLAERQREQLGTKKKIES